MIPKLQDRNTIITGNSKMKKERKKEILILF